MKKIILFFATLFILFSETPKAEEYSAKNPYKPTPQQIETLKQAIPNFPADPPMDDYTGNFKEKFMISNYPPGMFKYYQYGPANYDPAKKYPVLLLLHEGTRHMNAGAEYFRLGLDKEQELIMIVPIAPPGYDWNSAAPLALEALQDTAKIYNMDPKRIYISGYSMGGIGVYSMLARYRGIFAGAFEACGTYDPEIVADIDKVPLLIFHGQKDETFPASISRDIAITLKSAGHDVSYIELEGATHADCQNVYKTKGYWNWLLEQKKP